MSFTEQMGQMRREYRKESNRLDAKVDHLAAKMDRGLGEVLAGRSVGMPVCESGPVGQTEDLDHSDDFTAFAVVSPAALAEALLTSAPDGRRVGGVINWVDEVAAGSGVGFEPGGLRAGG